MRRRLVLQAAACAPLLHSLQGCGGAQGLAAEPAGTAPAAAVATSPDCRRLAPPGPRAAAPQPPPDAIDVRQHGVVADGATPIGDALQRLLDQAPPGQALWFPPGRYAQDRALKLRQTGLRLFGYGATLHATDPASQALIVQASSASVLGFTLTAVTDVRRAAPWEARIAVWRNGATATIDDVQIRDNRIVESGLPGSRGANSASAAGIYLEGARRFIVAGNIVRRSLADGIHVTGGSRDGLVVGNIVRETGDDMIGLVSYLGADAAVALPPAAQLQQQWPARAESFLVRNVLVTGNDLAGGYWGRGITVAGGLDISVVDNTLDLCVHAAAVYVAREAAWRTFGVRNVRVAGNRISRVQTTAPEYSVLAEPERSERTGHGALELVSQVLESEASNAFLLGELGVQDVVLEDNRITDVGAPGIRVGEGWGAWNSLQTVQGRTARYTGGPVRRLWLLGNAVTRSRGGMALHNGADADAALRGTGNLVDGLPWHAPAGLDGSTPPPLGSRMDCSAA